MKKIYVKMIIVLSIATNLFSSLHDKPQNIQELIARFQLESQIITTLNIYYKLQDQEYLKNVLEGISYLEKVKVVSWRLKESDISGKKLKHHQLPQQDIIKKQNISIKQIFVKNQSHR